MRHALLIKLTVSFTLNPKQKRVGYWQLYFIQRTFMGFLVHDIRIAYFRFTLLPKMINTLYLAKDDVLSCSYPGSLFSTELFHMP